MSINLLEKGMANQLRKTGETKKISVELPGQANGQYDVYAIPLSYLYFNDQNGRINTVYKQYKAEIGNELSPNPGDSEYNKIFEDFIYNSNPQALKNTLQSIKEKTQQEPGVVLPDGRVIDGNRRFTALRMYEREDNIPKTFDAVILPVNQDTTLNEKLIKELELDLQLGREERVNYDPIDRIFDVYNTIEVEKLMTVEEYKKASGAGNTKGIKRDIRLAELILKFIRIISPDENDEDAIDKFYLARELKLDGSIEEIEGTLTNLQDSDKTAITEAVLVRLAVAKANDDDEQKEPKLIMRELKTNVLKQPDILEHYLEAVDGAVDVVIDSFEENPIKKSNDLKQSVRDNKVLHDAAEKIKKSTDRLVFKGQKDFKRTKVLSELEEILDNLKEMKASDFKELTVDENFEAKDTLKEMTDVLFKLKKDLNE